MSSFELESDIIYEIDLSGSEEEKKREIELLRKSTFFSYLEKKPEQTERSLKLAIIFFVIGISFISIVVIDAITINIQGNSWLMGIGFGIGSGIFYLYLVALSTFVGNGFVFFLGAYHLFRPTPLTDAEKYFHEILKEMSESGENIEDYFEFQDVDKDTVGYKLKKAKIDWDFEKVTTCFANLDPEKISLALIVSIWLILGGACAIIVIRALALFGIRGFIIYVICSLTIIFASIFVYGLYNGFNTYRSLRKEFITAQVLQINKLYDEANRNPNDLVHQLKIANAHELLKRLEQMSWHPFIPLVKVIAFLPFITGLISFLLR